MPAILIQSVFFQDVIDVHACDHELRKKIAFFYVHEKGKIFKMYKALDNNVEYTQLSKSGS